MKYIHLDNWKMSKLTLGTVQLGMNYGIANKTGKPSIKKAFEILDTAIKGGINSFDTANKYGNSEEVLGKYFSSSNCKMKEPLVTTKFSIDTSQGIDSSSIERQIYGYVENSLETLKLQKIPVYMLHYPPKYIKYCDIIPQILKRLKDEGLIEKAGISVYNYPEVGELLQNELYEAVQLPMNIFDLRMLHTGILDKLKNTGRIVFVRSVFLQGLFFMDPEKMPESLMSTSRYLKDIHELAQHENLSVAQLALSFIRDMEGVTSLVLGAETPEQVADNIRLMEESPQLSSDTIEKVEKLSAEVPIEVIMNELHARWRR